jgi:DNA topoisomerase-3
MAKLIIAEKPSVARDIARVIGGEKKQCIGKYAYYNCNDGFVVANARGHLVRLALPEEYTEDWSKWTLSVLPMLPQSFKLKPVNGGEDWLKALQTLIKAEDIDELIEATDAGREGELIFRFIYNFTGCKKPFKRLWISSMTDESIKNGLANLLDGHDKDSLYRAGITRSKIDWLIGMNLSRLYSISFNTHYTIGRVQTATVNMIVQRDREIANFVRTPFYKLLLSNGAEWFDGENNSFSEMQKAEKVKNDCTGKIVTVVTAETKQKTEQRPLLHSLTSLQIEANDKYGYSAAFTLATAQELYEKKLLSYPRTESCCITKDMPPVVADTVEKLRLLYPDRVNKLILQGLNLDKRVVNDEKVSDHHALLPTTEIDKFQSAELTDSQENILRLVIERMFAALDKPYLFDETVYVFECEKNIFKLSGRKSVQLGWREYDLPKESEIPLYNMGDSFTAENLEIKSGETKPPLRYTESTLLKAMENIDRRIEDKTMREFVKERGLGTPATRAAIIEHIIKVGYIERKNKSIFSSLKGQQMIDSVAEEVKNVSLTADMEQKLSEIEKGAKEESAAIEETIHLIKSVIERESKIEHENRSDKPKREPLGKCPRCGGDVFEGDKNFYCENFSKKTCIFSVFKDDFFFTGKNKTVTKTTMKNLLAEGKAFVKGFHSKEKDKDYDGFVVFKDRQDNNGNTKVGFSLDFGN